MRIISDLHIHSKYSRACSKDLIPQNIDKWAKIKGVDLIGTGDFTHPLWFSELKSTLEPAESGFFKLRESRTGIRFILTSEVSCIYSQGGKLRRVHLVLTLPSFEAVDKFNASLIKKGGKLGSDGRPILGMNAKEVLKYLLDASPDGLMIPAHAWTPYFGVFGSKSGFDSIEECFEEMTPHVFAFETGLSSDPEMNWRVSHTDKFTIISSSDAHSLPRIRREADVMDRRHGHAAACQLVPREERQPLRGDEKDIGRAAMQFNAHPQAHPARKPPGEDAGFPPLGQVPKR